MARDDPLRRRRQRRDRAADARARPRGREDRLARQRKRVRTQAHGTRDHDVAHRKDRYRRLRRRLGHPSRRAGRTIAHDRRARTGRPHPDAPDRIDAARCYAVFPARRGATDLLAGAAQGHGSRRRRADLDTRRRTSPRPGQLGAAEPARKGTCAHRRATQRAAHERHGRIRARTGPSVGVEHISRGCRRPYHRPPRSGYYDRPARRRVAGRRARPLLFRVDLGREPRRQGRFQRGPACLRRGAGSRARRPRGKRDGPLRAVHGGESPGATHGLVRRTAGNRARQCKRLPDRGLRGRHARDRS